MDIKELNRRIVQYHNEGRIHAKRGYKLNEASPNMAAIHLIEETVEYAAACIAPKGMKKNDREKIPYNLETEEAADILLCWLHLNFLRQIPLNSILEQAATKLDQIFPERE